MAETIKLLPRETPEVLRDHAHFCGAKTTTVDANTLEELCRGYIAHLDAVEAGNVVMPREPTEAILNAMHHQIDWCRNDQNTSVMRHGSQKKAIGGELIGTFCEDDLRDAYNAIFSALPTPPKQEEKP